MAQASIAGKIQKRRTGNTLHSQDRNAQLVTNTVSRSTAANSLYQRHATHHVAQHSMTVTLPGQGTGVGSPLRKCKSSADDEHPNDALRVGRATCRGTSGPCELNDEHLESQTKRTGGSLSVKNKPIAINNTESQYLRATKSMFVAHKECSCSALGILQNTRLSLIHPLHCTRSSSQTPVISSGA